jgi:hypothetical protein
MEAEMRPDHEHDFDLILAGVDGLTRAQQDALYEAGCHDATIVVQCGRVCLSFSRAAPSREAAIEGANRDVGRAGIGARVVKAVSWW